MSPEGTARRSEDQGHSWLHTESVACLGYMKQSQQEQTKKYVSEADNLCSVWSIKLGPGQPRLHSQTLSQNKMNKNSTFHPQFEKKNLKLAG